MSFPPFILTPSPASIRAKIQRTGTCCSLFVVVSFLASRYPEAFNLWAANLTVWPPFALVHHFLTESD